MERMKPPIVPEKPVPVLTEAQLRALLAGAKSNSFVDRRDTAITRLLLDTGGRLSEVAGLTVADVDFDSDVVHVLGKGRRPRALPFGQQTGLALGAVSPGARSRGAGPPIRALASGEEPRTLVVRRSGSDARPSSSARSGVNRPGTWVEATAPTTSWTSSPRASPAKAAP